MRVLKSIPVIFSLFFVCGTAQAFVGNVNADGNYLRWNLQNPDPSIGANVINRQTKAIRFYIGKEAYSTQNREAEYSAVRSAFTEWQAVAGTTLKFEDAGLVASPDINTEDGTNAVFWTTDNIRYDDMTGVLANTYFSYFDSDNTMAEADIVLNGTFKGIFGGPYAWTADAHPSDKQFSIQGIVLHEIGHFIGLEHSPLGGATMLSRGDSGNNAQSDLSTDELEGVRYLYADATKSSQYSGVRGKVLLNGMGILGAVVVAEDAIGSVIAGTVSRIGGVYELPSMPPGNYTLRATPLDPRTGGPPLISDFDISAYGDYYDAVTAFLPTTPAPVVLVAGQTLALNVSVTGGSPAFRISRIRTPTADPEYFEKINAPGIVQAGQSQIVVGVYSPDIPASGATLTISGDGITHGQTTFSRNDFPGQNTISVTIDISRDATPGMRNLIVTRGSDVAYANGFLVLQAAPAGRYLSLSRANPISAGWTLSWQSQAGLKYQVLGLDSFPAGGWQVLSPSIVGTGSVLKWTDSDLAPAKRYFRLVTVP